MKEISTVLEYLQLGLRYVASGFVSVGIYMFLYPKQQIDVSNDSWFLLLLSAALGTITFALHFATADKYFIGKSLDHFYKSNNKYIPTILKKHINQWQSAKGENGIEFKNETLDKAQKAKIIFAMANQNYLRLMSADPQIKVLQSDFQSRKSLVDFLYCSFYQICALILLFLVQETFTQIEAGYLFGDIDWVKISRIGLLGLFGIGLLLAANKFNNRICSRNMWIITNYGQELPSKIVKKQQETGGKPKATGQTRKQGSSAKVLAGNNQHN